MGCTGTSEAGCEPLPSRIEHLQPDGEHQEQTGTDVRQQPRRRDSAAGPSMVGKECHQFRDRDGERDVDQIAAGKQDAMTRTGR